MKLIPSRKTPEQRTGEMTVVEHLSELRYRLMVCIAAVAVITTARGSRAT